MKTKRIILLIGITSALLFAFTACTSPADAQAEQQAAVAQQSLTLRIIDLMSEGKL